MMNIKRLRFSKKLFSGFTGVFFIYIAFAYLVGDGFTAFAGYIIDTVGVVLATYLVVDSKEKIIDFIRCMTNCSIIYSLMCIVEAFTGTNIFVLLSGANKITKMRYGLYRSIGSANMSINNGVILAFVACLLMYSITNEVVDKKKAIFAYILNAFALLMTVSRTPILAFLFVNIMWMYRAGLFRTLRRYAGRIFIVFMLLVVLINSSTSAKSVINNFTNMFVAIYDVSVASEVTSDFGSNAQGKGERFELYTWINDALGDNKLFGNGANAVFEHDFQMTKKTRRTKTSIENHYLKIYYYFGYIGLTLFILFLLSSLLKTAKRLRIDKKRWSISYFSMVAQLSGIFVWFLVSAIDDFRWYLLLVTMEFIICSVDRRVQLTEGTENENWISRS
jgi:hypothetical protein